MTHNMQNTFRACVYVCVCVCAYEHVYEFVYACMCV